MTRRAFWLFAAMSVIWGIPYLLIKVAVRDFSPASVVFLRTAIGASLLVPVVALRGSLRAVLSRWPWILVFTAVELGVPWLLLTDAERRVSSSLAGLMMASVPLVGVAVSGMLGAREPLSARRAAGLALGLGGVAALLGLDVGGGEPLVLAKLALVVVCYASGPAVIARRLSDLPTIEVVAVSLASCALAYAPVTIPLLPRSMPPASAIAAIATLGVACTALAFVLFFELVNEIGPMRATLITYVNPAVAVLAGVAALGERFTAGTAAGLVLILGGSWLATDARASRTTNRTGNAS